MKLLPSALAAAFMLDCRPLAYTDDGQSSAIDDEMDRSSGSVAIELNIETLAPTREGRVVGGFEIDVLQVQDRSKDPSVCRSGKPSTSRSVSAVSIA